MHDGIELVLRCASTLRVIYRKGAISDIAVDCDAVRNSDQPIVCAYCLPREVTSHPEAANIRADHNFLTRPHLMPKTSTDKRINPINAAGPGNCAISRRC